MLNERKLTKPELAKREDIVMDMKKNKRKLVKRYGKDAEKVMYGRATNMAKKQTENMDDKKLNLRKMIEDALQNPKGATAEKNLSEMESLVTEDKSEAAYELQEIMDQLYELSDRAKQIVRSEFPSEYSRLDAYGALDFGTSSNRYDVTFEKALENLDMEDDDMDMMQEDLDLGHQDDEPGMLKGDLYKIGKYSMELYQMMDSLEGMGEVDLPHWWQSKITTAKNMISGAKHYLDFEMKEPQIDAMVNVAAEEDIINEAAGKFVVRPCTAKDTPWAVWQTSEGGENDKRIEGFKTKEDAQKFAEEKNSMNEGMSEKEWAEATEKANLSKLKDSDQDKIKKIVAMLKAEKKPKK